jgi:hypothetical protein
MWTARCGIAMDVMHHAVREVLQKLILMVIRGRQ